MSNPILLKNYVAFEVLGAYRFITLNSSNQALYPDNARTPILGVTSHTGQDTALQGVDTVVFGIAEVKLGGTVAIHDPLTSGTDGVAVKARQGQRRGGFALAAGVSGDVIPFILAQGHVPTAILQSHVPDLRSSVVARRLYSPFSGKLNKLTAVVDAALATGDCTLTWAINGTAVTGGVITIPQATAAAGTRVSVSPTAANDVVDGDLITITVAGTNSSATATANTVTEFELA